MQWTTNTQYMPETWKRSQATKPNPNPMTTKSCMVMGMEASVIVTMCSLYEFNPRQTNANTSSIMRRMAAQRLFFFILSIFIK